MAISFMDGFGHYEGKTMFSAIKNWFTGENDMYVTIKTMSDGFYLVDRHENTVGKYSRRRDAVRGAKRHGFVIA